MNYQFQRKFCNNYLLIYYNCFLKDDKLETWMDFYTAFRILIVTWILKYFFATLRII